MSILVKGLALLLTESIMRSRNSSSSFNFSNNVPDTFEYISSKDLVKWQSEMKWLIPFVQASGFQVVIQNPKSNESIIINNNSTSLPNLSCEWMESYDKKELNDWMENEKKDKQLKQVARQIALSRGKAKFGNNYIPSEQEIKEIIKKIKK